MAKPRYRDAKDMIRKLFFTDSWKHTEHEDNLVAALSIFFEAACTSLTSPDSEKAWDFLNELHHATSVVDSAAVNRLSAKTRANRYEDGNEMVYCLFFDTRWRHTVREDSLADTLVILFKSTHASMVDSGYRKRFQFLDRLLCAASVINLAAVEQLLVKMHDARGKETWRVVRTLASALSTPTNPFPAKTVMVLNGDRRRIENNRQGLNRLLEVLGDSPIMGGKDAVETWYNQARENDKQAIEQAREAYRTKKKKASKSPKPPATAEASEDDGLKHSPFENMDGILNLDDTAAADSPSEEAPEVEAASDDSPAEATATEEVEVPDVDSVALTPVETPTAQDTVNAGAGQ